MRWPRLMAPKKKCRLNYAIDGFTNEIEQANYGMKGDGMGVAMWEMFQLQRKLMNKNVGEECVAKSKSRVIVFMMGAQFCR